MVVIEQPEQLKQDILESMLMQLKLSKKNNLSQ